MLTRRTEIAENSKCKMTSKEIKSDLKIIMGGTSHFNIRKTRQSKVKELKRNKRQHRPK